MKKLTREERVKLSPESRLVLSGRDSADSFGFVNPPIVRGSTVLFNNVDDYNAQRGRFTYGRDGSGTPTIEALEQAMTDLEGGAGVVIVPSGLMACTLALLASLSAGDHVLITDSVYYPTRRFARDMLKRFQVEIQFYNPLIGGEIRQLFKSNTRAVMVESPGSQTFEIQDVPAIVEVAHERGALVLMDNTWATPLYFNAHGFGVDYSIQAGTKYPSGHSDVMIGSVSARTPELFKSLRKSWAALGLIVGAEDAFLTLRGLRTLPLRLKHQYAAGLEMARWLESRDEILSVLHPALPGVPGHELWKRDFTGASSLFSVVLKPVPMKAIAAMLDDLTFFGLGDSWGGFESLVKPFDASRYRTAVKWQPAGPTLRFHIGLENLDELKGDLDAGFERLRAAC